MGPGLHYAALKIVHVCAVALSGSGFLARGLGVWRGASWVRGRAARTLPHLVDTVLLLSALGMLWTIRLSPWALPWLRAKIVGLVVYIVLGVIALRGLRAAAGRKTDTPGAAVPPGSARSLAAWLAALLVFLYIVSVALTKNPWGALSLL